MKSLVAVIGLVFMFSGTAFAGNDMYFQISGMLSSVGDTDITGTVSSEGGSGNEESGELNTDNTMGFAAEIGFKPIEPISAGLEFSYRNFDVNSLQDDTVSIPTLPEADSMKIKTLLANLTYEQQGLGAWKPYLGFGIGIAWVEWLEDDEQTKFAFQVKTGLAYEVSEEWDVFGGYKYIGMSDVDSKDISAYSPDGSVIGTATNVSYEVGVHNFEAGIKYSF